MRVPSVRRAIYSAAFLMFILVVGSPRAAQAQGQCWQIEICQLTAPSVYMNAAVAVSVPTIPLRVDFGDPEALDLTTRRLWRNGVNVSSWYDGVPGPPPSRY